MATAKKSKKAKSVKKAKNVKKKNQVKVKAKAKIKAIAKPTAKLISKPKAPAEKVIVWSQMISPLEDRVIVTFAAPSEKTAGGIIIPGSVSEAPNKGKVLAVGPGRRSKKGKLRPVDVKVGDEVIFPQHAGSKMTVQNTEILILREEEVLGIIQ